LTGAPGLTVVVVDENATIRSNVCGLLASAPGIRVAGAAAPGRDALAQVRAHRPDVVLLDLVSQPGSIVDVLRIAPGTAVLAVTAAEDVDLALTAIRAGARGYLDKRAARDTIVRAVRSVGTGGAFFGPPVALQLAGLLAEPVPPPLPSLTSREREVLALLATGTPTATIARCLGLAPKTVRNYSSAVFAKLGVTTRADAAARAHAAGLGIPVRVNPDGVRHAIPRGRGRDAPRPRVSALAAPAMP